MDCNHCKVPMIDGKVMAPILGNNHQRVERGDTIFPVGAALTDCLKCPSCGHSVAPMLNRDDIRSDELRETLRPKVGG